MSPNKNPQRILKESTQASELVVREEKKKSPRGPVGEEEEEEEEESTSISDMKCVRIISGSADSIKQ